MTVGTAGTGGQSRIRIIMHISSSIAHQAVAGRRTGLTIRMTATKGGNVVVIPISIHFRTGILGHGENVASQQFTMMCHVGHFARKRKGISLIITATITRTTAIYITHDRMIHDTRDQFGQPPQQGLVVLLFFFFFFQDYTI
eukprot:scaffold46214_cov60-Attheya_sp.AAC.2